MGREGINRSSSSEAVVKTVVKSQEALGSRAWNNGGALEEKF
jgi:hypothetical protein